MFKGIDSDNSGGIDVAELCHDDSAAALVYKYLEITEADLTREQYSAVVKAELVTHHDADGSGFLDWAEFLPLILALHHVLEKEHNIDLDGDGEIGKDLDALEKAHGVDIDGDGVVGQRDAA